MLGIESDFGMAESENTVEEEQEANNHNEDIALPTGEHTIHEIPKH